jgi:membrane associated rhomboid family serine protease
VARGNLFANLPKFRRGSFVLFAVACLVSAVLSDQPLAQQFILVPGGVLEGQGLWQPISANIIFPNGSLALVFGTLFVQWFLGSELEGFWGTRKYLLFVIGCGIAGYLASVALAPLSAAIAQTPVGGSTAMDLAATAAFGVVFGKRPLRILGAIPLSCRGLAIFVIALCVLAPVARGAPWPVVIPWLTAVVSALLVTTQPWRRLRDSGKVGGSKRKRRRSHLRVVEPDPKLLN